MQKRKVSIGLAVVLLVFSFVISSGAFAATAAKKAVKKVKPKVSSTKKKTTKPAAPIPAPSKIIMPMDANPVIQPVSQPITPQVNTSTFGERPKPKVGWFGWNQKSSVSIGYIAEEQTSGAGRSAASFSNSAFDIRADVIYSGGSSESLGGYSLPDVRIGAAGITGNDINGNSIKAVPVYIDVIFPFNAVGGSGQNLPFLNEFLSSIPNELFFGTSQYIGGGVNYTVYGNDETSGTYGGQLFVGSELNFGIIGKTYLETGYSVVRSGNASKRSAKGIELRLGQKLLI